MEEINKDNENFDKIKVFSSEDEKLKSLGELLSNKSSRDIIRLLIEKEMYTNEIAKKLELSRNLVSHHLQKMESIGLLEITNKKITRKGEEHRFFRIPHGMLIFPEKSEYETNNGLLKKIFKETVKFATIGIAVIASWVSALQNNIQEISLDPSHSSEDDLVVIPWSSASEPSDNFFLIPIIIIGCSLFLIWFSRKYK